MTNRGELYEGGEKVTTSRHGLYQTSLTGAKGILKRAYPKPIFPKVSARRRSANLNVRMAQLLRREHRCLHCHHHHSDVYGFVVRYREDHYDLLVGAVYQLDADGHKGPRPWSGLQTYREPPFRLNFVLPEHTGAHKYLQGDPLSAR